MKTANLISCLRVVVAAAGLVLFAGCSDDALDGAALSEPALDAADGDDDDQTGTIDFGDPVGEEAEGAEHVLAPGVVGIDDAAIDAPEEEDDDAPAAPAAAPKKPTPPPKPSYMATALVKPNKFFKRQVRHATWNPTGPLFSGNCAPASLAMIAKVFGLEPKGLTIEQSIDRVRLKMNKWSDSGGASVSQVRLGASRLGFKYRAMPKGDLDLELAKGHMVVLVGYPGLDGTSTASRYQNAFRLAGYWYTFDAYHSIAIFGKTASGRYVVADPMSKIGVITMSALQMSDFWKRWGGSGTALWR